MRNIILIILRGEAGKMRTHLVSSIALGFAMVGGSTGAFAQTSESSNDSGVGDIIVTAQKRSENVQQVPIAISAITAEYLHSRNISSIDNLGSIAPNLKIERAPSNKTAAQISIRGSVTINPAITWEPAVGLYLDGVYIAKVQGSVFDIADLERVEVLRGPQGTLYGRNALAGAINLVTRKPTGELHISGEATYGDYNYWKGKAIIDLPAVGPFSVKFAGQIQKRDGFIKVIPNPYPAAFLARPTSVTSTNDLNGQSFMAQVRFKPSAHFSMDYAFDYSRNNQRPDYAQLYRVANPGLFTDPALLGAIAPLGLYANTNRQTTASIDGSPLHEYARSIGHSLTASLDLGDMTLRSITAYRKLKFQDGLDLDGSPLNVAFTRRLTDFEAFSQELQASGTALDGKLKYVAGAFYYREKAETLGPQFFFGFLNQIMAPGAATLESDYGSHNRAYATFAQIDYSLTDALKLSLGGRYTHERKDIRRFFGVGSPVAPVFNLVYGGVPDAVFSNFSPTATVAFQSSKNINLYVRWARGYKSGGFNGETNDLYTNCPSASELCTPYRPETVDSYEVGVKTKLLNNTLIFNVAAFWDEHKDIQLSIFTAVGAASSVVKNAAAARIRGLEFEMVARPATWFTVNGSFSLLDAKYKRYVDAGVDVTNNRAFPHAPKYTAAVGVDWRVVQGDWGKLNLTSDLNFVSAYYTFPYALAGNPATTQLAGNTRSPGRTIVNMRVALSDLKIGGANFELAAWIRNLTSEKAPQNFIDFGPGFGGLTLAYFPDPRTYGVTLGFKL